MVESNLRILATVITTLSGVVVAGLAAGLIFTPQGGSGTRQADLLIPFSIMAVVFAIPLVAFPLYGPLLSPELHGLLTLAFGTVITVPWGVFALRYAGYDYLLTRPRLVVSAALFGAFLSIFAASVSDTVSVSPLVTGLLGMGLLLAVAVTFTIAGTVLLATYRYTGVPMVQSVAMVLPVVVLMLSAQTLDAGLLTRKFLNAGVFAISAGSLCLSVTRYDALTQRPGTSRLGVRAAVAEMDEPVLVVSVDERVTQANETAEKLLGAEITGQNVADVVGRNLDPLRERGVFECRTQRGYRQFDPRVSAVTGGGGQQLGATVTLIDVTDREMRRQRIQVLNRILRHNIRNDLSAIQARADLATDDDRDTATEVQRIVTIADELESLSTSARRIETLMDHQDGEPPTRRLDEFVESVVADVAPSGDAAPIDATAPSTAVALDWALLGYALRNVVANAVEHNDTETPRVEVLCETNAFGLRIVVADDGPGIPELEASAVQTGSEGKLDHATSIGLWGTSWAVQSLGGKVTIGESHLGGAEVTMEIPLADDSATT